MECYEESSQKLYSLRCISNLSNINKCTFYSYGVNTNEETVTCLRIHW